MSEAPPRRFSGGVAVPDFFSHSLHERMVGWLGLVFFLLFPDLEVFGMEIPTEHIFGVT